MKTLNFKATSAALLLTLFAGSAMAQPQQGKGPQGGGKEQPTAEKIAEISTDKLDQKLELTDAQESKIYAINLKYAKEREAAKAERPERPAKGEEKKAERPDREEMKAKQDAAQDKKKAQMVEIMKILTDEQKVEYALFIGQAQNRGPKGQEGRAPQQKGGKGNKGKQQGGERPRGPKGGEPQEAPQE